MSIKILQWLGFELSFVEDQYVLLALGSFISIPLTADNSARVVDAFDEKSGSRQKSGSS